MNYHARLIDETRVMQTIVVSYILIHFKRDL